MAKSDLPINPAILSWARKRAGFSEQEAADRVSVHFERLIAWEKGTATPTVNQARKLAKVYDRPFLEFLSKELPSVPDVKLAVDYRQLSAPESARDAAMRKALQVWAEAQRFNALDLLEMLGESPPLLPKDFFSDVSESIEGAAARIRAAIEFERNEQIDLRKADARFVPDRLRARMSAAGILVLRKSGLRSMGIRGICLFAKPMPIVVYNSSESPGGQAFTLAHELGHVALKSRAFSGLVASGNSVARDEKWCNQFAAAFLVPATIVNEILARPNEPADSIADETLNMLASRFAVSPHAMLIRLITLKYVESEYYWNTKRSEFIREEAEYTSPPMRGPYYGSRYKNSLGVYYTGLVLDAWGSGVISGHNAAEFLGIKNVSHLSDIRDRFPN